MKRLLLILIATLAIGTARAQLIAVGTDVVSDGLMLPNIGFELVTSNSSTLSLNVLGTKNPWGHDAEAFALQPEYRFFFSGRPMYHEFVGIGAIGTIYDVTIDDKVYDGYAAGVGLTFGYVFKLTQRINIDCHAGFGVIAYKRKEYFVGDHYDEDYSTGGVERPNAHGYYTLPTRIGVSLTYILK